MQSQQLDDHTGKQSWKTPVVSAVACLCLILQALLSPLCLHGVQHAGHEGHDSGHAHIHHHMDHWHVFEAPQAGEESPAEPGQHEPHALDDHLAQPAFLSAPNSIAPQHLAMPGYWAGVGAFASLRESHWAEANVEPIPPPLQRWGPSRAPPILS